MLPQNVLSIQPFQTVAHTPAGVTQMSPKAIKETGYRETFSCRQFGPARIFAFVPGEKAKEVLGQDLEACIQ